MGIFEAVLLGIIQGLTEFIPVSSKSHLALAEKIFKTGSAEENFMYTLAVHFGSLAAIIIVFRQQILEALKTRRRLIWLLFVGTIPLVIFGLLFHEQAEAALEKSYLLGVGLVATGIFLFTSQRASSETFEIENMPVAAAFIVGLFQSAAILPGISRSGITIGSGMLTGLKKSDSVVFSFLLGAIAICGATALGIKKLNSGLGTDYGILAAMVLSSFVSSFVGIFIVRKLVSNKLWLIFAAYCLLAGLTVVIMHAAGILP